MKHSPVTALPPLIIAIFTKLRGKLDTMSAASFLTSLKSQVKDPPSNSSERYYPRILRKYPKDLVDIFKDLSLTWELKLTQIWAKSHRHRGG